MGMNLIQFQPGLPLARFREQCGSEAKCRRAQPPRTGAQPLIAAAWADERNRGAS
jgi:hypothetical protein